MVMGRGGGGGAGYYLLSEGDGEHVACSVVDETGHPENSQFLHPGFNPRSPRGPGNLTVRKERKAGAGRSLSAPRV